MSIRALKLKVRTLAEDPSPFGFRQSGPYVVNRSRRELEQFIELQPGHAHLANNFTCNLAWKFDVEGIPAEGGFHHSIRIGHLLDGSDVWFPHEPEDLVSASYQRVRRALEIYGLPFLDAIDSIPKIVSQYEEAVANLTNSLPSPKSPFFFFGRDEGWKHCILGFCYKTLKRLDKAESHLKIVVPRHSLEPYDFVIKRKDACVQALSELEKLAAC